MGLNQPETSESRRAPATDQCRCECGSLLARIVENGVEIRCRRCKRDLLVPFSAGNDWVEATSSPALAPGRPAARVVHSIGRGR